MLKAKPGFPGSQSPPLNSPSPRTSSPPPSTPHLVKSTLKTCPPHLRDFPSLARPCHGSSSGSLGCLWPWVSVSGPFRTEKSPYVSFKTFYSIIYTFKIIICHCPSCHIHPRPPCGACGLLGSRWPQDAKGRGGATVADNHSAYPSHFPCCLGQEEVNRKPKACEPFTLGSEV